MTQFSVNISVTEKGRRRPEYTINSDLDGELSLQDFFQWTKAALISTSQEVLKDAQSQGFDKNPVTIVDGSPNKDISQVSPLGRVQYVSRQSISVILLAAYNAILDLSKVVSGLYKASHYVFLNGQQVATDLNSLQTWLNGNPDIKDGDLVRIVNIQPYARKLELAGITSGGRKIPRLVDRGKRKGITTGILIKKPNGTYQLALRRIQSKYSKNVGVSFAFITGYQLGLADYFKRGRSHTGVPLRNKSGKFSPEQAIEPAKQRTYLYPSLVFKLNKEGGLL